MDATDTMMNEHRQIERAIGALVAFAGEVARGRKDDREELGRFVAFIRGFADVHHHGKEEDILFAAMVDAGFPRQGGPIAVMLTEHGHGREYVRILGELAAAGAPWTDEARERLAQTANGYANLLRAHIHKEDAILYPMAEQRLPAEVKAKVSESCAAYDARELGSGELPKLQKLLEELAGRHVAPG